MSEQLVRAIDDLYAQVDRLTAALRPLVDDDPCRFDHNGFCQTHHASNDPGVCAVAVARDVLTREDNPR